MIRLYQVHLSSSFGGNCKFYPSCSHYAKESFENFSFFKAFLLVFWRLLRCHPFRKMSVDLVPQKKEIVCKKIKAS